MFFTLATDKMKFGKNTGVNYKAPAEVTPSKTTQVNPKTTQVTSKSTQVTSKSTQVTSKTTPKTPSVSVASEILGVTMMIGGFLISRYIF